MKQMKFRHGMIARFFVTAFMALLPMLTLGGGNAAVASPPLPAQSGDAAGISSDDRHVVLRVFFKDAAERDLLASELSAVEADTTDGYLTVYTERDVYEAMTSRLSARGIQWEIDKDQTYLANNIEAFFPKDWNGDPDTFYGGYRTVEENYAYMDALVAAYPTLAQKVDIGDTWCKTHPGACTTPAPTWNGYDIYALRITNQAIAGPKPVFWLETGIHSREIATIELSTRFMSLLLDQYNTNPDSRWVVDWHDIWVVPHVNPDGHHMVSSAGGPLMQRKNGDRDDGCTTFPPGNGQLGTDNNRNFPFKWNCCGGSSGQACSEVYRGPSAGSEEETQAIVNSISSLIPDQRGPNDNDAAPITTTGVYQSIHASAALNLYPWGWTTSPSANFADLDNIAQHMEATNASPPGNNYEACQPPVCLYGVDGSTMDWGYGELGIPSFTTEIGGGSFFPSYSTIDASLWPTNRGALLYQAKIARTPYLSTRGPDADTLAATPMTVTQGVPIAISGRINYNWEGNTYLQNVAAAEYYIDTPPWAGGTAIAMSAVDGTFDNATELVQATVNTGSLTPGRHLLLIRGRGVNDYEGFQSWGVTTGLFIDILPSGGTVTPGTATVTPAVTVTPSAIVTDVPTQTSTTVPSGTAGTTETPSTATTTAEPSTTGTSEPTGTSTTTAEPSATATACVTQFTDVEEGSTYYEDIRCLACRGIVSGYATGCESGNPCFRPGDLVTRGQLAKIVTLAAGFSEPAEAQQYEDVLPGSTFYDYIWRLTDRGLVNGYPCGGPGEPCEDGDRPYYRPNTNVSRGQLSKIVSNAAGLTEPVEGQQFEDVEIGSTFYEYIGRLTALGVINGYPCGGPNEPCGDPALPYFLPGNNASRAQASKIVANTFFPGCETP